MVVFFFGADDVARVGVGSLARSRLSLAPSRLKETVQDDLLNPSGIDLQEAGDRPTTQTQNGAYGSNARGVTSQRMTVRPTCKARVVAAFSSA